MSNSYFNSYALFVAHSDSTSYKTTVLTANLTERSTLSVHYRALFRISNRCFYCEIHANKNRYFYSQLGYTHCVHHTARITVLNYCYLFGHASLYILLLPPIWVCLTKSYQTSKCAFCTPHTIQPLNLCTRR